MFSRTAACLGFQMQHRLGFLTATGRGSIRFVYLCCTAMIEEPCKEFFSSACRLNEQKNIRMHGQI